MLPLTSIRFFLASWIVLFHLYVTIPRIVEAQANSASKMLNTLFCAYVAVSIFFVLSGFILALNYRLDQPWDAARRWRFAVARFPRIYPVNFLALILISGRYPQSARGVLLRQPGTIDGGTLRLRVSLRLATVRECVLSHELTLTLVWVVGITLLAR